MCIGRRLFTILSATSLLLCIAVCAGWIFSYQRDAYLWWNSQKVEWQLAGYRGTLDICRINDNRGVLGLSGEGFRFQSDYRPHRFVGNVPGLTSAGPRFGTIHNEFNDHGRRITIDGWFFPLWFVAVITAALPVIWLWKQIHRERFRPGYCRVCGYDLRATPERCPECGALQNGELVAGKMV